MGGPRKSSHAMTLEKIAGKEGMTVGAVNVLLSRAMRKLRKQKLLITARELSRELVRNRRQVE